MVFFIKKFELFKLCDIIKRKDIERHGRVGYPTLVFLNRGGVTLKKSEIIKSVYEISEKCAEELGYEIVDVEYTNGSKHDLLSIFIYKEDGIDLNDCQDMSRKIEGLLDEKDFIENPYYLEVSSPGLDRPIKTQDDYRRNKNKDVEVKLYAPMNGVKNFEGILTDYDEKSVTIVLEDKTSVIIPIKSISIMKQRIIF